MEKRTIMLGIFILLAIVPSEIFAAIIHVPADQPTIQAGINAATNGDTVLVADGVYSGVGNRDIDFLGKAITVGSESNNPDLCTVDGEGLGRGFYFHTSESGNSVVQGLTVQHGIAQDGGGIYCDSSSPAISNCTFEGNTAVRYGGGICCYHASPMITNCTISGNTTDCGGGIYCEYSSPTILNSIITGNISQKGGGIYWWFSSSPIIGGTQNNGNYFSRNVAGQGACIYGGGPNVVNAKYNHFSINPNTDYHISGLAVHDLSNCTWDRDLITQDVYVSESGNDANDGLAWDHSFLTIQNALSLTNGSLANPITIHVANGMYSPSRTGEIYPLPMVSYVSISGIDEQVTILDAEGTGVILYALNDNNFEISHLTLTRGNTTTSTFGGGGIYCRSSSPTISNCILTQNASSGGGGIFCQYGSSPEITNCKITENEVDSFGGGIYCSNSSSPLISNCYISGNTAGWGGGIYCTYSSPEMTNCNITENYANNFGGGIFCFDLCTSAMKNCTLSENTAGEDGGGIYCGNSSSPGIMNCILWEDSPNEIYIDSSSPILTYTDIQGGWSGTGNINANPFFVTGPLGDYYLSQITAGQSFNSPCLNTGNDLAVNICFDTQETEICLDELTTRTDHVTDSDQVDIGYHYPDSPLPVPSTNFWGQIILLMIFSTLLVVKSFISHR